MILEVYKGGNKVGEVRKALNRLCSESKKKKKVGGGGVHASTIFFKT